MISERTRIEYALLLSLLLHALLLSLNFGAWEFWLPHFGFLWQDPRIEEPDLRVVMVSPPVAADEPVAPPVADPAPQPSVEPPVANDIAPPPAEPRKPALQPREANHPITDGAIAAPAQMPLRTMPPMEKVAPAAPAPELLSALPANEPVHLVPFTPASPPVVVTESPSTPSPEPATAVADAPKLDASRQEEQRQSERQDTARAEAARVEAERAEAARDEAARVEAERAASARAEAAREEAEKAAAARAEAARVEAERAAAARAEAARVEAEKAAAARAEAARVEAERAAAARAEAARVEAEQAETERREAARRAIGRELDDEAAKRQAAAASRSLPASYSGRRYKLLGRTDPNAELIQWVEAWARKIQLNMTVNMVREAAKQPHTDPVVTVAMRSDGSVESVTLELSSGVPAIDDAIRRIVDSQAPYPAFPPSLAREWDVIEIRRTWYFDVAVRLY